MKIRRVLPNHETDGWYYRHCDEVTHRACQLSANSGLIPVTQVREEICVALREVRRFP